MAYQEHDGLDELIERATAAHLLDHCCKNEWQVSILIDQQTFIFNHTQACIFLEGLLLGARRRWAVPDGYTAPEQLPGQDARPPMDTRGLREHGSGSILRKPLFLNSLLP